jgi:hypothetical protein
MVGVSMAELSDADLLIEIRERYDACVDFWARAREQRRIDMRYVSGDPWDPADRMARQKAGRPCLALDELGQYFSQSIGDVRANPKAIKFSPAGNGANDDSAEFYENKIREIQYRSKAQDAYICAFENMLHGSYGYVRVTTEPADDRSFDLDIRIDPVPNPDMVYIDPSSTRPDASDAGHAFIFERPTRDEFKRKWPSAKITDFGSDASVTAPSWVVGDRITVAEYWVVRHKRRRMLLLEPVAQTAAPLAPARLGAVGGPGTPTQAPVPPALPQPTPQPEQVFEDEAGDIDPARILRERWVNVPYVKQYVTNGLEILDRADWPGSKIPIAACYGKILYADLGAGPERIIQSMTRLGRDPYMGYCFYRTCEIENVGMTTKNPYWAYDGQLTPEQMTAIGRSMHEPVAVLLAKPTTEGTGSQILPLPQRSMNAPDIQALSVGAEEMRRAIQAAMGGSPLPTSAQRRNEKSGTALRQIEQAGQRGTFHFLDSYNSMIEHVGVIIEDLLDKVIDNARDTAIRLPNDESKIVRVNDPNAKEFVSTKGKHLVTVGTGPNHDSEREAASEFADTLAGISPQIFMALGPQLVKLKNLGPIGDEIADTLEKMQPPELRPQKEGEGPDPKAVMAQAAQMQQQMAQMGQALEQAQKQIQSEAAKQQATIEKARIDAEVAIKIQAMRDATSISVAHINAAAKGASLEAHAMEEAQALGHAAEQADNERAHAVGMAAMQHDHGLESAQMQQQAMAQAQQEPGEPSMEADAEM